MKFKLASFSVFLLSTWLLVEFLIGFYGYMSSEREHSQALVAYRGLSGVFLLTIPFLGGVRRKRILILAPIVAFAFVFLLQMIFVAEQSVYSGLKYTYKVCLPFIILFNVFWLTDIGALRISTVKRITAVNATVLLANLSLMFFGIGYSNYRESEESLHSGTGFFYAGNEVSVTLIALMGLSVALVQRKTFPLYLIFALFCAGAIALNTKAALIGIVCITLVKVAISIRRQWLSISAVLVMLVSFWGNLLVWYQDAFAKLISRWSRFTQEYDVPTVLLGGAKRLEKISEQSSELIVNPSTVLLGNGWSGEAENNLVDLVYGFGLVGLAVFVFWLFVGPAQYLRLIGRVPQALLAPSSAALTLLGLVALVAGHTVQSASLSVFWALLVVIPHVSHDLRRRPHGRLVSGVPAQVSFGRGHH